MNWWAGKFGMPNVKNYAQLRRHYDKAERFRGTQDRPFGHRKYGNRRMRMLPDETIELEYAKHALVRWHPDGTISVRAYDQRRQGVFDSEALPKQIRVGVGTRVGPTITIYDTMNMDWWTKKPKPVDQRRYDGDEFIYERNTKGRVIAGLEWVHLRHDGKTWVPVDVTTITPIKWYEPDRKRTRQASKEYHIPDLVNAARAIISLGNEDILGDSGRMHSLAYKGADTQDEILAALKQRDFVPALKALRKVESRTYNHIAGRWDYEATGVSSTDVKALRDRVCVIAGLCELKSEPVVTLEQYYRIERRLKDFGHPDC